MLECQIVMQTSVKVKNSGAVNSKWLIRSFKCFELVFLSVKEGLGLIHTQFVFWSKTTIRGQKCDNQCSYIYDKQQPTSGAIFGLIANFTRNQT